MDSASTHDSQNVEAVSTKRAGADVHVGGLRHAALLAQLFGGTAHVAGDGLFEFVQFGDSAAKAAAADDLLFGRGDVFHLNPYPHTNKNTDYPFKSTH